MWSFLFQFSASSLFLKVIQYLPTSSSSSFLQFYPSLYRSCSLKFKVCKSVHHYRIQINQPTRCNNFTSLLLDVYVQLNMFRASSRPSSGAQQLQQQPPLVLPLERGGSSAVFVVGPVGPDHDQHHCYHHAPTVKPEAANAVVSS